MLSLGHDYNPHAQESEVGGFGVQDQKILGKMEKPPPKQKKA